MLPFHLCSLDCFHIRCALFPDGNKERVSWNTAAILQKLVNKRKQLAVKKLVDIPTSFCENKLVTEYTLDIPGTLQRDVLHIVTPLN